MDRQAALCAVYNAFVRDKAPPAVHPETEVCVYRGPNGERCAIGMLIPDDVYDPRIEAFSIALVLNEFPSIRKALGVDEGQGDRVFLKRLQGCHDRAQIVPDFHEDIRVRLEKLAAEYDLRVPALTPEGDQA